MLITHTKKIHIKRNVYIIFFKHILSSQMLHLFDQKYRNIAKYY